MYANLPMQPTSMTFRISSMYMCMMVMMMVCMLSSTTVRATDPSYTCPMLGCTPARNFDSKYFARTDMSKAPLWTQKVTLGVNSGCVNNAHVTLCTGPSGLTSFDLKGNQLFTRPDLPSTVMPLLLNNPLDWGIVYNFNTIACVNTLNGATIWQQSPSYQFNATLRLMSPILTYDGLIVLSFPGVVEVYNTGGLLMNTITLNTTNGFYAPISSPVGAVRSPSGAYLHSVYLLTTLYTNDVRTEYGRLFALDLKQMRVVWSLDFNVTNQLASVELEQPFVYGDGNSLYFGGSPLGGASGAVNYLLEVKDKGKFGQFASATSLPAPNDVDHPYISQLTYLAYPRANELYVSYLNAGFIDFWQPADPFQNSTVNPTYKYRFQLREFFPQYPATAPLTVTAPMMAAFRYDAGSHFGDPPRCLFVGVVIANQPYFVALDIDSRNWWPLPPRTFEYFHVPLPEVLMAQPLLAGYNVILMPLQNQIVTANML